MKKAKRTVKPSPSSPATVPSKDRVVEIDIKLIRANGSQPRQDFDTASLIKLADSIRRYGILQPLSVRKISLCGGHCYELVAGERRLRAAKLLGLKTVPCLLAEVNEALSAELALVENILRENLGMFEQAAAFAGLAQKYGLTQEEIASKMGMSQPAVANKMRLLRLTPEERSLITENDLTERHARALLRLPNKTNRLLAIQHIINCGYNVAETEKHINALLCSTQTDNYKPQSNQKTESEAREATFSCLDKYINKLSLNNDWIFVDKKVSESETVITLTIKKSG